MRLLSSRSIIKGLEARERESECLQTCSDVVVYPLDRHCGVCDGIPLLVFHNTPDATMHLGGGNDTVFRGKG